jgi:hypothetical protein
MKVVVRSSGLGTGRLFTQEIFLVHTSHRGSVDSNTILRPEELYKLKIPVAQTGIELTMIRLVAQCFNQLLHRVPPFFLISLNIFKQTLCFHKLHFIFAPKPYSFLITFAPWVNRIKILFTVCISWNNKKCFMPFSLGD